MATRAFTFSLVLLVLSSFTTAVYADDAGTGLGLPDAAVSSGDGSAGGSADQSGSQDAGPGDDAGPAGLQPTVFDSNLGCQIGVPNNGDLGVAGLTFTLAVLIGARKRRNGR